jgi:uncharacterized damage-inducible protein DinB
VSISQTLLPEFDEEMKTTRTVLERCPDEKFGWKPHPKSWEMGQLASHLARLPSWNVMTLKQESLDIAPPGAEPYKEEPAKSSKELLALFDKSVAEARAAIAETSDDDFEKDWTLLAGGQTIFRMPRTAVVRMFVMNHGVFHRGQLSVYLRLNDIPVPQIYGPSADEGSM